MFRIVPTNRKFYDCFDQNAATLVRAAERLLEFLEKPEHAERFGAEIKRLEHEADEVTHEAMEMVHKSFITPIERSDIKTLIESLDDVLDLLDDASRRLVQYEVREIVPEVIDLARVLVQATKVTESGVRQVRNLRKKNEILQTVIEIRRLENEGDHINHEILAKLFKSGRDALEVMKWKEIIEDIESAIDRCQDVGNVLEGIVLENT